LDFFRRQRSWIKFPHSLRCGQRMAENSLLMDHHRANFNIVAPSSLSRISRQPFGSWWTQFRTT